MSLAAVIPVCTPALGGNERRYVNECLDSGWISGGGPFVDRFESELTSLTGMRHAVGVSSGTAALHLALLVAGVGPGDEVLVSTLSFVAPANAIRHAGAEPVFVGPEERYWQIDPERVARFLARECTWRDGALRNRRTGRRVRAILPVHALGHPADMKTLREVVSPYELAIVEDAAEGLGARCHGRPAGSFGDVACLSFNGNKIVSGGTGGALLTNDDEWARRARSLSAQAKDDGAEYVHREVGFQYRLTNLHAAVAVAQLERLGDHVAAKRRIAAAYARAFESAPGIVAMPEAPWAHSTFWMYTILLGGSSRGLLTALAQAGIAARPLWRPLHENPPYRRCEVYGGHVAARLARAGLSLPCSVDLSESDQRRVIGVVLDG